MKFKYTILIFFFIIGVINAQPFGFGCLGLSGFYAGFSNQLYETKGISEFINTGFVKDNIEFKKGTGYRVGANIFRAKSKYIFVSAKGYYQFLKESHERQIVSNSDFIENINSNLAKEKYDLSLNHWGVGIDIGIPIFSILDWKIVEGNVMFHNAELNSEFYNPHGELINEIKYSPEKIKIGYFVGSGIILHLIPDYVSIEATAGMNFFEIDNLEGENVIIPSSSSNNKALNKSGFSATLQLNVGFPL